MSSYQAMGLSRKEIRRYAKFIREKVGIDKPYFPIVEFIETFLPMMDENFSLEIVKKEDLPNAYAVTYPDRGEIKVREEVYEAAIKGDGRARFTLAHELFHYIFHVEDNVAFARSEQEVPSYMDPEWQANTFAAELLIPKHLVSDMSLNEIVDCCKVSRTCAKIQISKY